MNKLAIILVTVLLLFPFALKNLYAHSGRTNSESCHNCNVGSCAGTYHCHGGGSTSGYSGTSTYSNPTIKPLTTIEPIATPDPTTKPTPTLEAEVKAELAPEASPTPQTIVVASDKEDNTGTTDNSIIGVAVLVGLGIWIGNKIKTNRNQA